MATSVGRQSIVTALTGHSVLVVGDLILDEYISGSATRVSREAPVLVVEERHREWLVGGAAMPALNVGCLGGRATLASVVGADEAGQRLLALLTDHGVDTGAIAIDTERRTTTKTRIVAEGFLTFAQQVARVDRLDRHPLASTLETLLLEYLATAIPTSQALLISNYRNGVITPTLVAGIRQLAAQQRLWLTVDSQGDLERFAGFDLLKCNHHEAAAYLGQPLQAEEEVRAAIATIHQRLEVPEVVITRASDGLSLFSAATGYHHLPATNRSEVFDATGAGDTVIAVLTLARAGGVPLVDACQLANLAAGVVIRKRGNQPITLQELETAVGSL